MKHQTALKGFIGTEWAVEPAWARQALAVIAGHKGEIPERENAAELAAMAGERPEDCRYTIVDQNRAIVDVYGAIVPRATLFSEWSGGVSCQRLQSDIAWIAGNDAIDEVLFVIHSPGGEVTGVSETAAAIYELRKTKTVTAYISGLGCSAAYWLAAACGKLYVNETGIVGSIGVMAVYCDDSKQLEMIGIEEIEFVSSQSPMKNADPKTAKGKAAVQKRVDSLAQVFVEAVAKYRGVSVATVLKNFGQGGVFVGAEAVKAGLCDQVGNFNDALTLCEGAEADIELEIEVEPDDEDDPEYTKKEQCMAEKQETATVAVDKAEIERMKDQLAALQADREKDKAALEALQAEKAALEQEKLTNELKAISKDWSGDQAKHLAVMQALVSAGGRDSAAFKAYVELQTAAANIIDASTVFEQIGSSRGGEQKSALVQLEEKARTLAAAEKIPYENAFQRAAEENQALYAQYLKEEK